MNAPIRICIAEDNPDARAIFTTAFDSSFLVHAVADGREALDSLHNMTPDVLVLDVNLPRVSGLEVLRRVRQDAALQKVKVVLVTGNAQVRSQPGVELADLLLLKPVDVFELRTLIERLMVVS